MRRHALWETAGFKPEVIYRSPAASPMHDLLLRYTGKHKSMFPFDVIDVSKRVLTFIERREK
jgi:hypothetical protein